MTFQLKSEAERNGASIIVPVPLEIRRAVERIARRDRISLGEVGRRAFRRYVLYVEQDSDLTGDDSGNHNGNPDGDTDGDTEETGGDQPSPDLQQIHLGDIISAL